MAALQLPRQPHNAPVVSTYVSIRQHTSAYVSIRQHTSAYVSVRQRTSAYVRREAGGRLASKGGGRSYQGVLPCLFCRVYSRPDRHLTECIQW
jgi:hypothetical protein